MPQLITTHTRITDQGKPSIITNTGEKLIPKTMIWAAGVTAQPIAGISAESLGHDSRIKVKTQSFFVHLIPTIGFRNKFFVLLSRWWSYFLYNRNNRLIIARPKDGVQ